LETDIGRPISHISLINGYDDLIKDIEIVQDTLQPIDREIKIEDKKSYLLKIRPYRTDYGAIDGVIITFTDITTIKNLEGEIENYSDKLKEVLSVGKISWFEYCPVTDEIKYDDSFIKIFESKNVELPKKLSDFKNFIKNEDFKKLKTEISKLTNNKVVFFEMDTSFKVNKQEFIDFHLKGKKFGNCKAGNSEKILITLLNITDIVNIKQTLLFNKEILNVAIENSYSAISVVNENGEIVFSNKAAEKLFGISSKQIKKRTYRDDEWAIEDINHQPIPPENLPFNIIKRTLSVLKDYKHYIKNPKKGNILLNIDGTPIILDGKFKGAIFVIDEVNANE